MAAGRAQEQATVGPRGSLFARRGAANAQRGTTEVARGTRIARQDDGYAWGTLGEERMSGAPCPMRNLEDLGIALEQG